MESSKREGLDITDWLDGSWVCLGRAVEGADGLLSGVLRKAKLWERISREPVSERQRKVLNRLIEGFEGKLATCSEDTALRDIQVLIA